MSKSEITIEAILAEMQRLSKAKPNSRGGMTKKEIVAASGLSVNIASRLIHAGVVAGKLRVEKVPGVNIAGDPTRVVAYFPVVQQKGKSG